MKKKDLIKFFIFIEESCPWFMINGPNISSKTWQKVGRDLNSLIQTESNEVVPSTIFSYWGLIRDIIDNAKNDGDRKQLLSVAELCLWESRPSLPCSIFFLSSSLPVLYAYQYACRRVTEVRKEYLCA